MTFKINCLPVLDSFHCSCCTCSLKTATLALGWFHTFLGIMQTACYALYLMKYEEVGQVFWFDSKRLTILLLAEGILFSVFSVMMLYGVYRKSPHFMLPYLLFGQLGIYACVVIITVVSFSNLFSKFFAGLIILMSGCAIVSIMFYMWLVQYSYYRKLIQWRARHRNEATVEKQTPENEPMK